MTPKQIDLVQRTWQIVAPNSLQVGEAFYNRLFEIDPSLRGMFAHDVSEQGRKLMEMINVAVNGLPHLELVRPEIENLGRRHLEEYRVTELQYNTVGNALLWTLDQALGDAFNLEVEAAWTEAYHVIADIMKSAAYATV
ncbi:MAG TPA: globin family protein [Lacipirellulaceae bacterium]|jgi:hemoglobin-like flavoprotein